MSNDAKFVDSDSESKQCGSDLYEEEEIRRK